MPDKQQLTRAFQCRVNCLIFNNLQENSQIRAKTGMFSRATTPTMLKKFGAAGVQASYFNYLCRRQ